MGWKDSLDKPSKQKIKETHYSGKKKREKSDEHRLKLSLALRKTPEEYLQQFQETHGDRYDYSKVEYVERSQKIIIICPEHGEFLQLPRSHLIGRGCPKCKQRVRQTNVIEQFKKVHGDRYDYSKVEYVGAHQQVIIICMFLMVE